MELSTKSDINDKKTNISIVVCFYAMAMMGFMGVFHVPHIILISTLLCFVLLEFRKNIKFKTLLILICMCIVFSMVSSLYFRGQSLFETLKASSNIFLILFYFFLTNRNYSLETIEKVIVVLGLSACVLFIMQYFLLSYGIVIIKTAESVVGETMAGGQQQRFRLIGSAIIPLSYFLSLNKLMTSKGKSIYIICASLGLIVTVLMGFRTMIAVIVASSFFLAYKINGLNKRTWIFLLSFLIIAIILLQIPAVNEMFMYMLEKQEDGRASFSNPEYIRWTQLIYFLNFHFKSNVEMFFGSGLPAETSSYGAYNQWLQESGIYYEDWGLIGLSWMIGVIPVVLMCTYAFKAYKMKVGKNYKYIGVWFIYLLIISVTTKEFFREGNFVIQAIALYVIAKANINYTQNINSNENRSTNIL